MLADSGLPHKYCAEAVSTAAYLINRSPTKSLSDETPFESWHGKKPNVKHLRGVWVFGVQHTFTSQEMSWTLKQRSAFSWAMVLQERAIVSITRSHTNIIHNCDVIFNELTQGI